MRSRERERWRNKTDLYAIECAAENAMEYAAAEYAIEYAAAEYAIEYGTDNSVEYAIEAVYELYGCVCIIETLRLKYIFNMQSQ